MAHDLQCICFLSEQLVSNLDNVLELSTNAIPFITWFSNIFNKSKVSTSISKSSVEDMYFRLLNIYKSKSENNFFQKFTDISELLSLINGTEVRKFWNAIKDKGYIDINNQEHNSSVKNINSKLISERHIKHVQYFLAAHQKSVNISKLELTLAQLQSKIPQKNVYPIIQKHGAIFEREFLERRLIELQERDDEFCRKKQEIRLSLQFSDSYIQRVKEKEAQLCAIKAQISHLKSCISGLQRQGCEHYLTARKSKLQLANCLDDIAVATGATQENRFLVAQKVLRLLQSRPHKNSSSLKDQWPLLKETCNRLNIEPFSIPMEDVLLRLKELISDADADVSSTNELQHALTCITQLYNTLKSSLSTGTDVEKRLCIMGLSALKKISFKAKEASKRRDALQSIWSAWIGDGTDKTMVLSSEF